MQFTRGSVRVALFVAATSVPMFMPVAFAGDCTPSWEYSIGQPGLSGYISKYAAWDDGTGEALYASGAFTQAGGGNANRLARWDGDSWEQVSPIGPSDGWSNAVLPFQDKLILGGFWASISGLPDSRGIAAWNGTSWSTLGTGWDIFSQVPWSLVEYNGELYVGGVFTTVGGVGVNNIARWDGETWSDVGGGVTGGGATIILEMVVWDDGTGPAIFAAGRFAFAGGAPAEDIAKWDGEQWHSLGGGLTGTQVLGLAVWDDGTGEALYTCGSQSTPVSGGFSSNVHRWDGSSWTSLPDTIAGPTGGQQVYNVEPYDDGSGPSLFAVGNFSGNGVPATGIARWDGADWHAVGGAGLTGGSVFELYRWNDPDQPGAQGLYVGGSFLSADGQPSVRAALWNGCLDAPPACAGDLTRDGQVTSEDLNQLLAGFGQNAGGDLDRDGDTDSTDLNILLANFGQPC